MSNIESEQVKECLTQMDVHDQWENDYRHVENENFYNLVFDQIVSSLSAKENSSILDVGCGIGAHSIRLAQRGFNVTGIDFAEGILEQGKSWIRQLGYEDRIEFQQQDLLCLTIPDNSFDYILCWGVLMHIPKVEDAIAGLIRVLKPGGKIVISEGNMHSLQSVGLRSLKFLSGKGDGVVEITPQGYETWTSGEAGTHVTRQANIQWLISSFKMDSCRLLTRMPGQFTELYTRINNKLIQNAIHSFNKFYFKFLPFPSLAQGNILVFEKAAQK